MFLALHDLRMARRFESTKATASSLFSSNAGIDGPGKTCGALTYNPLDLNPSVKALHCRSNSVFLMLAAAPMRSMVQSEKVLGFNTFLFFMFHKPPTVPAVLFPRYMTLGAGSTRPGTAIMLGSTVTPNAACDCLLVCEVLRSQDSLNLPDRHTCLGAHRSNQDLRLPP